MTLPLNPKEKQELARIMLRCAMWVSISDEAGGNSSQSAEERVLKRRIRHFINRQEPEQMNARFWGLFSRIPNIGGHGVKI